jgi:hypothetical protein
MNKLDNFKINNNVAYFLGVLHSDGCIYTFNNKVTNRKQIRINLGVGKRSIPMSKKFAQIFLSSFGRTVNIRKVPNKESYVIQTSINRLWYLFKNWNNEKIPIEIQKNKILFCTYLAGLIDGDGHIKIKNNIDRILPQCRVRISSSHPLIPVGNLIKKYLNCAVHYYYVKTENSVDTCFYVSKKNIYDVKKYVIANMVLPHKIDRFNEYLKKYESGRI